MEIKSKSPFKFLDSYSKEDKDIFFGRDDEINELYYRVFKSKILLLYGDSGVGKTSLIRCGLANKFYDSDWFPIFVRRGDNINTSLLKDLVKCLDGHNSTFENEQVTELIERIYHENFKPITIIFDQFEELFIFGNETEIEEFISIINTVISSKLQCRFIFSFRGEYLGKVSIIEKKIPELFSNRVIINPMRIQNAKVVIEKSCLVHEIFIENGCSDLILYKLFPKQNDVDLTYLQIFLDHLYHLSEADNQNTGKISFTKNLVEKAGDVKDVLGAFLEFELSQVEDHNLAYEILKSFVSNKGTKQQVTGGEIYDDIRTTVKNVDLVKINDILQKLVNFRILKDRDENDNYELRHDSLATKINEGITPSDREIRTIRKLIKDSLEKYLNKGTLINQDDLKEIEHYRGKLFLNQQESTLIDESHRALLDKTRRKRRIIVRLVSAFVLCLTGFAIWALIEKTKADNTAIIARSNETASFSLLNLDKDPTLSFRLAEQAFQTYKSPLAMEALSLAYETATYNPLYIELKGHQGDIYCMDYTIHGNNIITGSFDSTSRIWDLNGRELFVLRGHKGRIFSVKFSPNGLYILTSSEDSSSRIWNRKGKLLTIIRDPEQANYLAEFSPDSKYVVTASKTGMASIWKLSIPDIKPIRICNLPGHQGPINSIHFSSDLKYIATTSTDHTARIWDYSGNNIAILSGHDRVVRDISFSHDNSKVVTSSDDNTARIWSVKGKLIKILPGHTGGITRGDYTPDGKFIICTSDDGNVSIWDTAGSLVNILRTQIGSINRLSISPNSRYIAIGADNGICQVWSIEGSLLYFLKRHFSSIREIKFAGNNDTIITSSSDATAKIWILKNRDLIVYDQRIEQTLNSFITSNSKALIVLNKEGSLSLFYPQQNKLVDFHYKSPGIKACFSSDHCILLTSSYDNTARIWNSDGKLIFNIPHPNSVKSIEFSPDEKFILTSCNDGTARILDRRGQCIKELKKDKDILNCASYSPNGTEVITGSTNSKAIIWNKNNGTAFKTLTAHKGEITNARYSPDGSYILTTTKNGVAILWDKHGILLKIMSNTHRTAIEEIGFTKNSEYFFTFSKKPFLIQIWNRKGELVNIINLGDAADRDHYPEFSEDGKSLLVITNTSNRIYLKKWPLNPEELINNVNQRHLFGTVRKLSSDELKEFYLDN